MFYPDLGAYAITVPMSFYERETIKEAAAAVNEPLTVFIVKAALERARVR